MLISPADHSSATDYGNFVTFFRSQRTNRLFARNLATIVKTFDDRRYDDDT